MSRKDSGWVVVRENMLHHTRFITAAERTVRWGDDGQEVVFLVTHDPDYIMVAAMVVRDGRRYAVIIVQDHIAEGPSCQLIAGNTRGKTPEQAAHDEFGEEGGWRANTLHRLGEAVPQTDRIISATPSNDGAKRCIFFLATDCEPTVQKLEPGEKITVHLIPWGDAVRCAFTGEVVPGIGMPIMDMSSRLCLILADRKVYELEPERTMP